MSRIKSMREAKQESKGILAETNMNKRARGEADVTHLASELSKRKLDFGEEEAKHEQDEELLQVSYLPDLQAYSSQNMTQAHEIDDSNSRDE